MPLTIGRTAGGKFVMQDGKFVNCACCGTHSSDCNPSRVPTDLPLVVTFLCVQFTVTISFGPFGPGGTDGWAYTGADIDLCDGFRFRALNLWCSGGAWQVAFVYTIRNSLGVYIQFQAETGAGVTATVVVSTNPICLTATLPGAELDCGSGTIYLAIGSGCNVVPPCCNDSGLSSTATLTYTIAGMAAATLNLSRLNNHPRYFGFADCDVGDGHTVVRVAYDSECSCADGWTIGFLVGVYIDTVLTRYNRWVLGPFLIGSVSANFAASCSPYHLHFEGASNDASGGTSQICGGKTYNFPAGGINAVLDVVTP